MQQHFAVQLLDGSVRFCCEWVVSVVEQLHELGVPRGATARRHLDTDPLMFLCAPSTRCGECNEQKESVP